MPIALAMPMGGEMEVDDSTPETPNIWKDYKGRHSEHLKTFKRAGGKFLVYFVDFDGKSTKAFLDYKNLEGFPSPDAYESHVDWANAIITFWAERKKANNKFRREKRKRSTGQGRQVPAQSGPKDTPPPKKVKEDGRGQGGVGDAKPKGASYAQTAARAALVFTTHAL